MTDTRLKILEAGLKLWPNVTSRSVGNEIGISHVAVLYHFPDDTLKSAVAEYAVEQNDTNVLRHLVINSHELVGKIDPEVRQSLFSNI